jgi:hypothetical protein
MSWLPHSESGSSDRPGSATGVGGGFEVGLWVDGRMSWRKKTEGSHSTTPVQSHSCRRASPLQAPCQPRQCPKVTIVPGPPPSRAGSSELPMRPLHRPALPSPLSRPCMRSCLCSDHRGLPTTVPTPYFLRDDAVALSSKPLMNLPLNCPCMRSGLRLDHQGPTPACLHPLEACACRHATTPRPLATPPPTHILLLQPCTHPTTCPALASTCTH